MSCQGVPLLDQLAHVRELDGSLKDCLLPSPDQAGAAHGAGSMPGGNPPKISHAPHLLVSIGSVRPVVRKKHKLHKLQTA